MRFPRPKHHPHNKSSHLSPLTKSLPLLCPPTKGERSWGESISETRISVHKAKRGPEGVGASVRAKRQVPEPPETARKTFPLLPQTNRISYPAAAVGVGRGTLISVLDPLLGVGKRRRPTSEIMLQVNLLR